MGRDHESWTYRNIKVVGEVDTIIPYLIASDIAICPIFAGAGTNLKLLDYLAAGLPTITTTLGLKGLEIDQNSVLVENNIVKYPELIKNLKKNITMRKKMSRMAINTSFQYSWPKIQKKYVKFIENIINNEI